ncbi:MAG: VWA domain-containing protein, partial [Armatimonadota bacterium]|nr:VWA domain-containing protein [Armatimonadota bacterium]
MRFLEPIYLGLLPLALLGVWWSGRRILGISRARKRFVLALRFLVVTLLILALAAPQAVRPNRGTCVIFALDMSDSISDKGRQAALDYIKQALKSLGENDQAGLVVFGRDALVDFMPTELRELPTIYSKPEPDGTNIAAAIRLASAMFPDGKNKRIVLLTDGNETEGNAQDAALVAATEGIEIDVIQLAPTERDTEVLVLETQAPSEVKIGEPFNLRVVIEARKAAEGTLVIDRDGTPVKRVPVKLTPGKNVVVVPVRTEKEGFHRYRVMLEASPDSEVRNNLGRAFVRVQGKPRMLLAEGGTPDPTRALEKALKANNLEVTRVNAASFPTRAEELQNYDAILFHDFPATALSPQMMLAIQSAVRDTGIGFAMIGGTNSFLSGGYYQTPIADLLPVDLDVRHRKVFPPATVVIVMDISGSMAELEDGVPKIQLAAKAAIETLKMLRPQDQFGVVVSGEGADWLAPIQKAENREHVIDQISRVYAGGGGIYMRPSLQLAENALVGIQTTTRHVIVLADGNDCDSPEGTFEIAARMRAMGITMSVVSLGKGKDVEYLRQLARIAGGNFYLTERARDLPRLFTADVAIMTRAAIEEGAFLPKISAGEEMLQGINWQTVPPLLAYDLTADRPMARTLMRTHKDDPLLAVWQYGLGQSLAFTSDAKPKWAQRWVGWSEFAPFWTQVTRSILRKSGKQ